MLYTVLEVATKLHVSKQAIYGKLKLSDYKDKTTMQHGQTMIGEDLVNLIKDNLKITNKFTDTKTQETTSEQQKIENVIPNNESVRLNQELLTLLKDQLKENDNSNVTDKFTRTKTQKATGEQQNTENVILNDESVKLNQELLTLLKDQLKEKDNQLKVKDNQLKEKDLQFNNQLSAKELQISNQLNAKDLQINNLNERLKQSLELNRNSQVLLKDKPHEDILLLEEHFQDLDTKLEEVKENMQQRKDQQKSKGFFNKLFHGTEEH